METSLDSTSVVIRLLSGIVITLGLVAIGRVVNWVWVRPKRLERCLRKQNLKGNSYKIVFGDMKEMGKMMQEAKSKPINLDDDIVPRVLPFHQHIIQSNGKNSFIWFGPTPMVNITNPEEIKDVLNKFPIFQKVFHTNPLIQHLVNGLITYEGDKWVKHRKIINPAFHLDKLKLMAPSFYKSCNEMIKKWKKLVSEKNGICEIDAWTFFHDLSADVISRTAFGSSYEEGKRIFQLQLEQTHLTVKVMRSIYVPGWRFVPTKTNRRLKEIENEMRVLLKGIIHKREKARDAGVAPNDDLLDILLESNRREMKDDNNEGNNKKKKKKKNDGEMSIEEIIKECKLFYLAGQETTSCLLNWTIVMLSKFPKWQTLARQEVFQVFGTQQPDYDGLNRLKVVTMILYEVLRLYPPGPTLNRVVSEETRIGNISLPAGVRIAIPAILVHKDPQFWGDDAEEFKPQRFSDGISKASKSHASYLPFGWGPRICIGQNFALVEAKMAISLILQNFSFELSPSYAHAPFMVLTLQPQFGTHIILRKL